VRARHQKIIVANSSKAAIGTPTMDRAILANDIVVADHDLRFPVRRKGKILGRRANNRAVSDKIACADRHIAFNDHVRLRDRFITDYHLWPDCRKRPDLDIGADSCAGIHKSRRVNLQSTPASLKLK